MKDRQNGTYTSSHALGKNNDYSCDFIQLIGKKIELSLRNQEPIVGIFDSYDDTSLELLICGHSFMINRSDILDIRGI
jgi:hypothetical protein